MRICIDRINSPPPHALTRAEVKDLLAVVPTEWLRFVKTIHLSATLPSSSRFNRPVILSLGSDDRLNVCSRGLEPDQARREILRELAHHGLDITPGYANRLSHQQLKEVDEAIAPLLRLLQNTPAGETETPLD